MTTGDMRTRPMPNEIGTILFDESAIANRIQELANEIGEQNGSGEITIICALTGALIFTADLARKLESPVKIDCIRIESYGNHSSAVSTPEFSAPLKNGIKGKNVLIVDDILDTGHTLSALISYLKRLRPSSIRSCVLLDKPARREVEVNADFVGFTIPDQFVVGYGLDYAEQYRSLPYIATIDQSVAS